MSSPSATRFSPGARLGPYAIVDLVGAGGMGEVYRARDSRLDRIVAIKVLSAAAQGGSRGRERFEREARAISRLSHPHICAVYDVGRERDADYIVMEYLEGETLARRLDRRGLRYEHALTFAVQIASALAEAHRAGIVHRDLKPANVMLTASGAKLLDFGLAKEDEDAVVYDTTTSPTITAEGELVGTLPYMSPEQVEGKEADARSDIFAFGSMLHEMITQRRAFDGGPVKLIAAILSADPPRPSSLQPRCPPALDHLVARCLAKDPAERWQSAQDLLLELRWAVGQSPDAKAPLKSHATRGWTTAAIAAVTAALAVAIGLGLRGLREDPVPVGSPRQVTAGPGWESAPAVSPDGGLIAYASDESGHPDLRIVDVRGGDTIQLTNDPALDADPAWFPDASAVAFTSDRGGARAIWKVLRLGGAPSLLVPDARDATLSADGSQIAFARPGPTGAHRIWIARLADVSRARELTRDSDGLWDHREPAFSPDGRTICYRGDRNLWLASTDGRPARRLTDDDERDVEPAWSADGRHVYFASFRGGAWALWRVLATGGQPQRLTLGTGAERHPTLSRDGKRLALATYRADAHLVLLDLASGREGRLRGLGPNPSGPSFAPDGRTIAFSSDRIGGRFDLWTQPVMGVEATGPPVRLTDQPGSAVNPVFSPDGSWVAYYRVLGEQRDIWIVPAAGGNPLQFTDDPAADFHPAWSPDGKRIAFLSQRGGRSRIWVAPVADGRPAGPALPVTSGETDDQAPAWSADGRWIAYVGTTATGEADVRVVPSGGGPPRVFETQGNARRVLWDRGGQVLIVSGRWDTWVRLRKYSFATGKRIDVDPALRLGQNPALIDFTFTADGRFVAFAQDELRGDVWALESLDRPY